jgi:hypothetical protein
VAVGRRNATEPTQKGGKSRGWGVFFEVENGLRKVETDATNFDFKWPLALRRFLNVNLAFVSIYDRKI